RFNMAREMDQPKVAVRIHRSNEKGREEACSCLIDQVSGQYALHQETPRAVAFIDSLQRIEVNSRAHLQRVSLGSAGQIIGKEVKRKGENDLGIRECLEDQRDGVERYILIPALVQYEEGPPLAWAIADRRKDVW